MQEFQKKRTIIVVTGKTGYGKTYLTRKLLKKHRRVIILDPNFEYTGTIVSSFYEFAEYMKSEPEKFCIVCRFEGDNDEEYLFRAVWEIGNCLLVIEEFADFVDEMEKGYPLHKLIRRGRHKAISILGVSQRVPDFPPVFRSQCDTIITFCQTEPIDLQRLESNGFDPEKVSKLPYYQYELKGKAIDSGKAPDP
jgi:hypothetical protein